MPVLNETLTVLGGGLRAASVALRESLRFKTRKGSLIIQDATGRGAMILSSGNKMALEKRRVIWIDLADRRHPVSLFQIRRSDHLRGIWTRLLRSIRSIAKVNIGDGTIAWGAEVAYALSSDGSVGLGALCRCLSSPESRRWFLTTGNEPADLLKLLEMIAWALAFPAVYAVSEGENRCTVLDSIEDNSVLWLESAVEHFEPTEHLLLEVFVEAALEDALKTMAASGDRWAETMRSLSVVHLYPTTQVALPPEEWVAANLGAVRHVGAHRLDLDRALPDTVLPWVQRSEFLWVVGPIGAAIPGSEDKWLSTAESRRVSELLGGELWVRSNRSGKSTAVRMRDCAVITGVADRLRSHASRKRRQTTTGQVSAAVNSLAKPPGEHRDLFSKLSAVETLRMGWFRVRESKAITGGADGVTIATFNNTAERELAALSAEQRSGQYRCRPLRRIQIPKPDGGVRNLGISCIRDRVVQAACLALLEPIFEPHFSRYSYGFRHGRNAHHAIAMARSIISLGHPWVVIADIRKCFDSIDHDILLGLLAKRIADEELLALIRAWLMVDVVEFRDLIPSEVGVPQGESISPLLANVYLDPLDKHLEWTGAAFVRYADDFVILTESEESAKGAVRGLADFLRDVLRLELKPAKTSYVAASAGFDFLGFRIASDSIVVKEAKVQAFLQYVAEIIKDLAANPDSLGETGANLSRINSIVRGWRNYFLLPGEPRLKAQLRTIDQQIDELAALHLPNTLRDNPAWLCRERLSLNTPGDEARSGPQASARAAQPGPGYPEPSPPNAPPGDPPPRTDASGIQASANGSVKDSRSADDREQAGEPPVSTEFEDGERLYVLNHGTYVTAQDEDLVLKKRRVEVYRRPINKIGLIYLQGFGIGISVDAEVKLAEHDIPVVLAPPLGKPVAVVNAIETSRASIRRLQAIRREEPDVLTAGMAMIGAKVSNQAAVLKYFGKYRKRTDPKIAASLMDSATQMLALAEDILRLDSREANVRASVMGFEGHAAAIYWRQLAGLVPEDLGFGGRVTLSAQDPVNQCLNYIYGLLYGEVWRAVVRSGLDPYFGLIHGSLRDQGSLVFDLIEEFRAPFGDRVLISMLGRGFRPEIGSRGFLRTRSKRQLVRGFTKRWAKTMHYRSHDLAPVNVLAMQADSLVAVFQREGSYHPYRMRW